MTRRERLTLLLDRVQRELAEEEARQARITAAKARIEAPEDEEPDLDVAGAASYRGRPCIDAYTADVAREAHRMYSAGNRDPWVVDAERQYQRANKRASRARLSA